MRKIIILAIFFIPSSLLGITPVAVVNDPITQSILQAENLLSRALAKELWLKDKLALLERAKNIATTVLQDAQRYRAIANELIKNAEEKVDKLIREIKKQGGV